MTSSPNAEALLPCANCGTQPNPVEETVCHATIRCPNTACRAVIMFRVENRDLALAAWNRRAASAESARMREALQLTRSGMFCPCVHDGGDCCEDCIRAIEFADALLAPTPPSEKT